MPTAQTTLIAASSDTRQVLSIVAMLIAIGIALLMLAWWMFKVTRPDREVLAPLEVMGQRKWRRGDPVWQRRRLDEVRPREAQPLRPARTPPAPDAAFDAGPQALGFDDLVVAPDAAEGIELGELPVVLDDEELDGDPTPPSLELPLIAPEAPHSELAELGEPGSDQGSDADDTVAIGDVEPTAAELSEPADEQPKSGDETPAEVDATVAVGDVEPTVAELSEAAGRGPESGDQTPAEVDATLAVGDVEPPVAAAEPAELAIASGDEPPSGYDTVPTGDLESPLAGPAEPAEVLRDSGDEPPSDKDDTVPVSDVDAPRAGVAEPAWVAPKSGDATPTEAADSKETDALAGGEAESPVEASRWRPPESLPGERPPAPVKPSAGERVGGEQG
jgi:hypothetical protein